MCFNHTPIPFTLEDIVAHESGLGPRATSSAAMSLASTLLDRRIPEMTIKVFRVRRLCQDALVGMARLPISTTELVPGWLQHTVLFEKIVGELLNKFLSKPEVLANLWQMTQMDLYVLWFGHVHIFFFSHV